MSNTESNTLSPHQSLFPAPRRPDVAIEPIIFKDCSKAFSKSIGGSGTAAGARNSTEDGDGKRASGARPMSLPNARSTAYETAVVSRALPGARPNIEEYAPT